MIELTQLATGFSREKKIVRNVCINPNKVIMVTPDSKGCRLYLESDIIIDVKESMEVVAKLIYHSDD